MQVIVVKHSIVNSFCAGTVLIDVLEFLAASRNRSEISRVVLHEGIDNTTERGVGAVVIGTAFNLVGIAVMASHRTSVLVSHSSVVAAVKGHLMTCPTYRNAICVNGVVLFPVNEVSEL